MTDQPQPLRPTVLRMLNEGLGIEDIAVKLGVEYAKVRKVVWRLRSDGVIEKPQRELKRDIILRMAKAGHTVHEICAEARSDHKSVSSVIAKLRHSGLLDVVVPYNRNSEQPGAAFRRHEALARARLAARTSGGGKDIPADMRDQIEAFDPRLIKRLPAMYAWGGESSRGSLTGNALIRVAEVA